MLIINHVVKIVQAENNHHFNFSNYTFPARWKVVAWARD